MLKNLYYASVGSIITSAFALSLTSLATIKRQICLPFYVDYKYFFNVSTLSSCITTKSFKIFFTS